MSFGTVDSPSVQFLRDTAAKHFVCMSFRAIRPDGSRDFLYASCFLVEVEGHWFLVTAGHVISDIRAGRADGTVFAEFWLHDKPAGNKFDLGVPVPFDDDLWIVFDTLDADFAAMPLPGLIVENLRAGGVVPVGQVAWGPPPFEDYDHWLLTGVPAESYAVAGDKHSVKLTIIPLRPTAPPFGAPQVDPTGVDDAIAAKYPAQYGQIITQPNLDGVYIADVKGMSGSPVYGLKAVEGKLKYWLLGVQCGWFEGVRVVKFHPSICFFNAFEQAIQQLGEGAAG